jgi:beta-lactamase regulating signal transducer with metallopeptidase domain
VAVKEILMFELVSNRIDLFSNEAGVGHPGDGWKLIARPGTWRGHPVRQGGYELRPEHLKSIADYFDRHYAANGAEAVIAPMTVPARAVVPAPLTPATGKEEPAAAEPMPAAEAFAWRDAVARVEAALPWLVCAWLIGAGLLSLRLLIGWRRLRLTRRNATECDCSKALAVLKQLCARMGIRRAVRLLESAAVQAPVALGWLRPAVLFPLGALAQMTPDQIEVVLVHELAHIRCADYVVNLLQSVVETVLFYHPAVHWLSRRARLEREYACDDAAVRSCGDPVRYARTLADLVSLCFGPAPLVPAVTGGDLYQRVRRLFHLEERRTLHRARWLAGALVLTLLVGGGLAFALNGAEEAVAEEDVAAEATEETKAEADPEDVEAGNADAASIEPSDKLTETEKQFQALLEKPIPPFVFEERPLDDVLDIFKEILEQEPVFQIDPPLMDQGILITLNGRDDTLRTALNAMLHPLGLDYTWLNGRIFIATPERIEAMRRWDEGARLGGP